MLFHLTPAESVALMSAAAALAWNLGHLAFGIAAILKARRQA